MQNEFTYVVEPPDDEDPWFIAYCPEVPEANGQGKTDAEAIESLKSAIRLILDHRREDGLRGVPSGARQGIINVA